MTTLYTFWDNIIPYKTESVQLFVPVNSATKGSGGSNDLNSQLGCRQTKLA